MDPKVVQMFTWLCNFIARHWTAIEKSPITGFKYIGTVQYTDEWKGGKRWLAKAKETGSSGRWEFDFLLGMNVTENIAKFQANLKAGDILCHGIKQHVSRKRIDRSQTWELVLQVCDDYYLSHVWHEKPAPKQVRAKMLEYIEKGLYE